MEEGNVEGCIDIPKGLQEEKKKRYQLEGIFEFRHAKSQLVVLSQILPDWENGIP